MRLSERLLLGLAAAVPLWCFPAVERIGAICQVVLGQRWGAGSLESEIAPLVQVLPQTGAIVFDVGAYKGRWAETIVHMAPARIERIYAFEPGPHANRILAPKTEVVRLAVSDQDREAILYAPKAGAVTASLYRRRAYPRPFLEQERVRCITLDAFTDERQIKRIDLLKLDIEGHELAALRGANRLLEDGRIGAIVFEFGAANVDSRTFFYDFWSLLTPLGFRFYRIVPGGRLVAISRYRESMDGAGKSYYLTVSTGTA